MPGMTNCHSDLGMRITLRAGPGYACCEREPLGTLSPRSRDPEPPRHLSCAKGDGWWPRAEKHAAVRARARGRLYRPAYEVIASIQG